MLVLAVSMYRPWFRIAGSVGWAGGGSCVRAGCGRVL